LGILRHAERESERRTEDRVIDGTTKTGLISLMLRIVDGASPPGTRSPEGQLWMKRRAINVLGALGDAGAGNSVLEKLVAILGDDTADVLLRCDAAVALGRMRIPGGASPDPTNYAKLLAELAGRITRGEVAKLVIHKQKIEEAERAATTATTPSRPAPFDPGIDDGLGVPDDFGGGDFGGGGGDFGGGGGFATTSNPADVAFRENYKVDLARRRLAYCFSCALCGMKGPYDPDARAPQPGFPPESFRGAPPGIKNLSGLSAEQKKIMDGVTTKLVEMIDVVTAQKPGETRAPKTELQTLIDTLNTKASELDTEAGIKRAAPAVGPVTPPAATPPGAEPAPAAGPPAAGPPAAAPAAEPASAPPP
jgi:hypothetical protein